jgi:radical SAM superfamily enzyme YgiQ (UPF0313 family)
MDILFLHVPKFSNHYKPIGRFTFINLPPVGLLGLADYLRQNHYDTRVIHLSVERQKYGTVDFEKIIAEHRPAVIGLGLHWHFQSYDVIEIAMKIKRTHPEIAILLGGFTASYFADEILREFDCVDFIIRGDAEVPLVDLLAEHYSGKDYHKVRNLAFRENGSPKLNPIDYVADQKMLDSISFTDFSLMKDWPVFVDCFSRYVSVDGLSPSFQKSLFGWKKTYPMLLGRGCGFTCSYCGGSAEAQKIINNRTKCCFRSVEAVLASLQDLQHFGFESTCLPLDPLPRQEAEEFYLALFKGMKQLGISLNCEVERYSLPTRTFIRAFRESLGSESFVTLSLNSQNETLRRKNGLYRYSNEELEDCLCAMDEEGINCAVFFTCGLPFESRNDLTEMAQYQQALRKKFRRVQCKTSMIEIEPGSPMSMHPQAYGIEPHRKSFMDYYSYHGLPSRSHYLEMGYDRVGCAGYDETARFFCRNFCSHFRTGHMPPLFARSACYAMSVMWEMGAFRLIEKILPTRKSPSKCSDDRGC